MSQAAAHDKDKKKEYFYFVGDERYTYEFATITGAQIKARIPNFDPTYTLMLEGPGNEPDTPVADDTSISLEFDKGPRRFYIVPPANFGSL